MKYGSTSFTPKQVQDLAKSGISPELAIQLGFRNVTDEAEAKLLLKRDGTPLPALAIPFYKNGDQSTEPHSWRLRPDSPRLDKRGKRVKYEHPSKTRLPIYFPPNLDTQRLFDKAEPLLITEGEKKAICAVVNGRTCVGGLGVDAFHDKKFSKVHGVSVLKSELKKLNLLGRKVFVFFDARKLEKLGVLKAERRLAQMLKNEGAIVYLVHLPAPTDDAKDFGLDDLLVTYGKEKLQELMDSAWLFPTFDEINRLEVKVSDPARNRHYFEYGTAYLALEDQVEGETYQRMLKTKLSKKIGDIREKVSDYRRKFLANGTGPAKNGQDLKLLLEHMRTGRVRGDHRRDLSISKEIIKDLNQNGRFIRDKDRCFYFSNKDHSLSSVEFGEDLRLKLWEHYGVNQASNEYAFVMSEIEGEAKVHGQRAAVYTLSYYCEETETLYFCNGPDHVFKIMAEHVQDIKNGDEGVYFETDNRFEPFKQIPSPDPKRIESLFQKFSFSEKSPSASDVAALIRYYAGYMVFKKTLRPILFFHGRHGSAKSTICRMLGRLLVGGSFDVTNDIRKRDDLVAVLCGSSLFAWDNIEDMADEMINVLCTAATGGMERRRKLYVDNKMLEYPLSCAIVTNARSSGFQHGRPDLTDRMIPIELSPITKKVEESRLYKELQEVRNHFWSLFLKDAQLYLKNLKRNSDLGFTTNARMADFWIFLLRSTDKDAQVVRLLQWVIKAQSETALDSPVWVKALEIALDKVYGGKIEKVRGSDLLSVLKRVAEEELQTELGLSATQFARYFKEQMDNLSQRYFVEIQNLSGSNHYSVRRKSVTDLESADLPYTVEGIRLGQEGGGREVPEENDPNDSLKHGVHGVYGVELNKIDGKKNILENKNILNKGDFTATHPLTPATQFSPVVLQEADILRGPGWDQFVCWRREARLKSPTREFKRQIKLVLDHVGVEFEEATFGDIRDAEGIVLGERPITEFGTDYTV